MKKIIILFISIFIVLNFSNCKKSEVLKQGSLSISITKSDATTSSSGYAYYLQFNISETGGSTITISDVHILIKKNGTGIGEKNYTATQVFSNNQIGPFETMSSKHITLTQDSEVFADTTTITISGNDEAGNRITGSSTASFPDLTQYPTINSFEASTSSVAVNETAVISWDTSNATRIYLERNGNTEYDNLEASGSITVSPTESGQKYNNYVLYATNGSNSVHSSSKSITVNYPDVEYRVSGVFRANIITISGKDESTEQYSYVKLPWSYTIQDVGSGDFLYVSAQSNMTSGCIKVEIYKNGELWKEAESCGKYVIASVSGSY